MDSSKFEWVRTADAMNPGEQLPLSPAQLRKTFRDRIAIDNTQHETSEGAFLASLIGWADGHYTLRADRRSGLYVLARLCQPYWLECLKSN